MAKKHPGNQGSPASSGKPSALVDTRVIYCRDNLEQLRKLPDACVDLVYIDPPFNSDRNYEKAKTYCPQITQMTQIEKVGQALAHA